MGNPEKGYEFNPKEFFSEDYFSGKRSNYIDYSFYDNDRYWSSTLSRIRRYGISGRLLDVGCGFGFFLKRASAFFEEIHGLDVSEYALEQVKIVAPESILHSNDLITDDLPFPDHYFDLITAFDVLEHTPSIRDTLAKLVPKIKQDGYLMASVPLSDTWAGRVVHMFERDTSHFSVPTRRGFFEDVRSSGLSLVEVNYFYQFPFLRIPRIPAEMEVLARVAGS